MTTRMMHSSLVIDLLQPQLSYSVGNKAKNLRRLSENKFHIPHTYVIPWEAYERYENDDQSLIEELRLALKHLFSDGLTYAVRSSANIEDTEERSYAGQFRTVLNVSNIEQALEAIQSVWSQVNVPSVDQYREKTAHQQESPQMAVIIQEMVTPLVSGVAFSRNPMNGADEVIIEAVQGEGLLLVESGITPQRWVFRAGRCKEQPVEPILPLDWVEKIAVGTNAIAQTLQQTVDAEWVFDGQAIYWVQAREITSLQTVNLYSNRMSREMIPGIIKPLVWSINIPLVNTVWVNLMREMIGDHGVKSHELAKSFYYRAYFNMTALGRLFQHIGMPPDALDAMMGLRPKDEKGSGFKPNMRMMRLMPRLVGFAVDKWRFQKHIERHLPSLKARIADFSLEALPDMTEEQLLAEIDRLFPLVQEIAYYNIVGPILMAIYTNLFNKQLKKAGLSETQFDLMAGVQGTDSFDPNYHLRQLKLAYDRLSEEQQARAEQLFDGTVLTDPALREFREELKSFLKNFGHFSDSGNDFSSVPWREQPALILQLVKNFSADNTAPQAGMSWQDLPVSGIKRRLVGMLHRRARYYRAFRDEISSLYTYGYGLFRPMFLSLADHLMRRGWLSHREDIFYIPVEAVRQALSDDHGSGEALGPMAEQHRNAIAQVADYEMPSLIYGEDDPPIIPSQQNRLSGTATSSGYYRGPVRVVKGLQDFHKLQPGDVLVVPFTDVGWTPLFARAGAVVSDSGGMLSHSSIIAREYHIPAVVSVPGATRLPDGMTVLVDGFKGEVIIFEEGVDDDQDDIESR
jgi:phosphohistidine swiveling domain-containing protein